MNNLKQELEPIKRLSKDLRKAASNLTINQVRYLVDLYYQIQDFRIQSASQSRQMNEAGEPVDVIDWIFFSQRTIEHSIKQSLDVYTDSEPTGMGAWAKSIIGIGPVISAGLLANIDMEPWKCRRRETRPGHRGCTPEDPCSEGDCGRIKIATVGQIWRFAGLDPTSKWEKKTRRPWNAKLKVLCWKMGESFIKFQNHPKDFYGKLYVQRKAEESASNDGGGYADQAKTILETKNFLRLTDARKSYESGKLPPAHIHARARRWAVKIFLYHWFAEAYKRKWNAEPPKPYVIEHLGHAHMIEGPKP